MGVKFTQERKDMHSKMITAWKPWLHSTGPRSREGKAVASRNSFKGAVRPRLRAIAKELREYKVLLSELENWDKERVK